MAHLKPVKRAVPVLGVHASAPIVVRVNLLLLLF